MSSRVQKGNAVFKPVTKARPRAPPGPGPTASRQASVVPTSGPQDASSSASTSKASMPPPSTVPLQTIPEMPTISPGIPVAVPTPAASIPIPSREPTVPRTFTTSRATIPVPNIVSPQRNVSQSTTPVSIPIPGSSRPQQVPILISTPSRVPVPSTTAPAKPIPTPAPTATFLTVPSNSAPPAPVLAPPASPSPPPVIQTPAQESSSSQPQGSHAQEDSDAPVLKTKRKRSRSKTATPDEGEGEGEEPKKRSGRGRRSRGPSLPPYDPNADPGEDIDPTVVTMATLCNDTGQGRVSSKAAEILSNHAAWKQRNREKRTRMRAIMEAKKYGRTDEEAELLADQADSTVPLPTPAPVVKTPSSNDNEENNPNFDYSQELAESRYNVQVRIGPNGETIIDEDSLVVNREETDETANYTHITESDHTKFVNSGTYGKRYRGSRWSAEETELFFEALSQFGENYELIAYVLPGRDRKSCKNKFKIEDKRNHARINYCLNNRKEVDIATLSRMTGKDFSGPVPEIRAPAPPPQITPETIEVITSEKPLLRPPTKRRRGKSSAMDDGVVIVGDIESMQLDNTED
ncbi:hypothetical protein FA15DRAFT_662940 [Coprinopsis marcescibilis]|uniref:Uncharacterized protein n=1 Tax=Coprinopsis marcescibilis TaxID=230819 RepID=A0A5C3LDI6_COPMA|nr:hypothetical protein FA15DRAFT_662940 [Coprinopsis marcescibilis]